MKIKAEWVYWAKKQVLLLKDRAYLILPDGAVFQIDKVAKTFTTICEKPGFQGSEVDKINNTVFSLIGYKIVRPSDTPISVDAFVAKIEKLLLDSKSALHHDAVTGVSKIFNLSEESIIEKFKKKSNVNIEPINPITLQGHPRLSIARLWIQSDEISSGQHVFSPGQKRENMDHTMQFVFWEDPQNPLGRMLISNERKFIEGIWMIGKKEFVLDGIRHKSSGDSEVSKISFLKNNEKLIVAMDEITATFDWNHFYNGLKHLFPKGELINHLAN